MTGSQRLVLILGMVLLAGCLLYPPWHVNALPAAPTPVFRSLGYAFLFSAPNAPRDSASLDLTLLFTQMGAVAVLTGVAFVALGWRRKLVERQPKPLERRRKKAKEGISEWMGFRG